MKRNLIAVALISAGVFASASAVAANNHTVNVNAAVVGTCKFNTAGPTNIAVTNGGAGSTIDPSLTGLASGTANIAFRCTANATSSVLVNTVLYAAPVAGTVTSGGGDTMAYTLTLTDYQQNGTGFGAGGSDLTLIVTADIAEAVYAVAAAGNYTDAVTLTINP